MRESTFLRGPLATESLEVTVAVQMRALSPGAKEEVADVGVERLEFEFKNEEHAELIPEGIKEFAQGNKVPLRHERWHEDSGPFPMSKRPQIWVRSIRDNGHCRRVTRDTTPEVQMQVAFLGLRYNPAASNPLDRRHSTTFNPQATLSKIQRTASESCNI